ncbi:TnsA endonuclease N-terminal domain-containing protein [Methylophilus sp. 5]|uniref:TnsA endonuclease N-terminal domain-containing protein n=1 Tax=Methylophilus sp. 5 TaxID=1112274 RepID=UPI0004914E22|nr:TnsA endonuclease N-terminal domain-containing protein [Methylophilus sp. 5]
MRKGRKFTPSLIEKWLKEGRGTGVFSGFKPLHQVTRGDPGSSGLSRIMNLSSRPHHLLSDKEYVAYLFARIVPGLVDIREQFHLSQEDSRHELSAYSLGYWSGLFPGTLTIAKEFGIKHPRIQNRTDAPWPNSTDLLLTLKRDGSLSLLAISVKPDSKLSDRVKKLIELEKRYWEARSVDFLLITPETYLESVMINMTTYSPWGHDRSSSAELLLRIKSFSKDIDGLPLSHALRTIKDRLNVSNQEAQNLFWECVWKGILPVDLNRKASPGTPINLIILKDFWKQNPVASRRSAWLS